GDEGAEGRLLRAAGHVAARPATQILGCLFVDDFFAEIAAVAFATPERFDSAVRWLLARDAHAMTARRRAYRHRAPAGWRRVERGSGLNCTYLPADAGHRSEPVVAAALPAP